MICFRPTNITHIFRSKHYLISLLKNPKKALKQQAKNVKKPPNKLRNDEILNLFPKEFHRKTNPNTIMAQKLYLINESTAKKIAQYLASLPDINRKFVEINPGTGVLTNLLLQNGMTDLQLYEGNEEFLKHLTDSYANVYPDRVQLKQADLIALYKSWYADSCDTGTRIEKILVGLPVTEWQSDINFRLFGATASMTFFKYLINSIVFQSGIMALGRCEMYMVIPSTTYTDLTSSTKTGLAWYRSNSILFQIFFELLDKFASTDFLPHISKTLKKAEPGKLTRRGTGMGRGVKCPPVDPDLMYFIKLQEFWHFVKRNCHSRTSRIIPALEKLIPGCGVQLLLAFHTKTSERSTPIVTANLCEISTTTNPSMTLSNKDYYEKLNIFTQFGDLEPSQLFTLFHEFRMLPEYSTCTFLPSLDSVL